jgi:hypothetical protein
MEDALTEADALAGGRQDEPALLDDEGPSAEVLRFITTTTARELYGLRPGETVAQAAARKARDDRTGLGEGAA